MVQQPSTPVQCPCPPTLLPRRHAFSTCRMAEKRRRVQKRASPLGIGRLRAKSLLKNANYVWNKKMATVPSVLEDGHGSPALSCLSLATPWTIDAWFNEIALEKVSCNLTRQTRRVEWKLRSVWLDAVVEFPRRGPFSTWWYYS